MHHTSLGKGLIGLVSVVLIGGIGAAVGVPFLFATSNASRANTDSTSKKSVSSTFMRITKLTVALC